MTARASQALFAVDAPKGSCASGRYLRSAWSFSMIAWPRWALSATTVVIEVLSVVVKNAWCR